MVKFKPLVGAFQSRFKFRHREVDPWRRLMDASFFQLNFITRPRGEIADVWGGHWTHIITCAHVTAPWMYPNYYPPVGMTKYVSRVSMADTMQQIRVNTMEGNPINKNFISNYHHFYHSNKRLDICASHTEMYFRRQGEHKLMNMTTEGLLMRPRLEIVEELKEGDHVWIYGMKSSEDMFDEEKMIEPLMIPTGIKGRVIHKTKEVFFVDTSIDPLHPDGVQMGMCGGPVMRNGKVVGMLTAKVDPEAPNKDFAGHAMCCYSRDIWDMLIDVEQQMNNPPPIDMATLHNTRHGQKIKEDLDKDESESMYRYRDYDKDESRVSRHIPVPISLFRREREWIMEQEQNDEALFGRSSPFNQEYQENVEKMNMNESSDPHDQSDAPANAQSIKSDGTKPYQVHSRDDPNQHYGVYVQDEFATGSVSDKRHFYGDGIGADFHKAGTDPRYSVSKEQINLHGSMQQTMDNIRDARAHDAMKNSIGTEFESKTGHYSNAPDIGKGFGDIIDKKGRIYDADSMGQNRGRDGPHTKRKHARSSRFEDGPDWEAELRQRHEGHTKKNSSEVEDLLNEWGNGSGGMTH